MPEEMPQDWAAVGDSIRRRRHDLNKMTQEELARKAKMSLTKLREIEGHKAVRTRDPDTLKRISRALGFEAEYLDAVLNQREEPYPHAKSKPDESVLQREILLRVDRKLDAIMEKVRSIDAKLARRPDILHPVDASVETGGQSARDRHNEP